MSRIEELIARFDVDDPDFIADPYPLFRELREATPIFWNERTNQWVLTRFGEISETLRDRRLGRNYTHLYSHREFGRPDPDPRWAAFHEHEHWSLLSLEPPDHTRLRRSSRRCSRPGRWRRFDRRSSSWRANCSTSAPSAAGST